PAALTSGVLPAAANLLRPFVENGFVWKVQLDTYDREIPRYGGAWAIALCESLFQADSDAVCENLGMLTGDASADDRWRVTFDGIDRLLDDFDLDLPQKLALMRSCANTSAQEFRIAGRYKRLILAKYRKERELLEHALARSATNNDAPPGVAALERRAAR